MNQAQDTRRSLLREARKVFADKGYTGGSVRAITQAAGANLGAVSYHFGSKEALYHAVLASVWAEAGEAVERESRREAPPLERLEAILRVIFTQIAAQPDIGRLILRELAETRPVATPIREQLGRLAGTLKTILAAGQADGSIVAGDPQLLILSIVAQPFHVLAVRNKLRDVLGLPAQEEAVFARVVDNAVAFARRGLSATGRTA
jgi:AcrR family transcriptional regulator